MLVVRPARTEDTPGILQLIEGVFAEYDLRLNAEEDDPYLLEPGPYFRASGGEFWVGEDEGRVKATVAVYLHRDAGELKTLYVHPSLRRQGWGRKLVRLAMDYAYGAGKHRMFLWSDTRFLDAHRLYRSLGFEQRAEERDLFDTNNSREYGFERPLP